MGNRLKLNGNVGHDPKYGKDRDKGAKGHRFAISAGNKIGDRGEFLLFTDSHHFAQQKTPGEGHQGGGEVANDEIRADRGRPADIAVKGPRGKEDRDGKGVDIGV